MEIKLYAPSDCFVKGLEECSFKDFSRTKNRQGFIMISNNNKFWSPFDDLKIKKISFSKESLNLEVEINNFCIIVRVYTNNFNKNFITHSLKEGQILKFGESFFSADFNKMKISDSKFEVALIFQTSESFKLINNVQEKGLFEKGDLLATIILDKENINDDELLLTGYQNKYQNTAKNFISYVGSFSNFKEVYNCMTRLRFIIKDKKLVDTKSILKNALVKGIKWNGLELQIVIGGECYKIKDEIFKIKKLNEVPNKENKPCKPSIGARLMQAVAGIMAPNVPILMGAGIISALYAVFCQVGLTQDLGQGTSMGKADLFSSIMFISSKTGLLLIGVFFCVNTTKYFGGNYLLGLFIGLALVSRYFYGSGIIDPNSYHFGAYIQNANYGVQGWYLFSISDYPIVIRSYEGSVLPFIIAGIITAYSDKWIKSWMPNAVDIIFRTALVFVFAIVPTLFLLGPLLSLIEFGMSQFIFQIEGLPIGLGVAIFAFIWQPLVLTGVHVAVILTIMIPLFQGTPSLILPGYIIAVWAQVGVAVGVLFATKNRNLKVIALGAIPGGIFGVTEPIIYGVSLPKGKPFLVGCAAAFFGGMLSGILDIKLDVPTGQGILSILGISALKKQLLLVLVWIITISLAAVFTFFVYRERVNEYKYVKKINKKIMNTFKKDGFKNITILKKESDSLLHDIHNSKKVLQNYENYLIGLIKIESKIFNLVEKEATKKNLLYISAKKILNKKKSSRNRKVEAVNKYNKFTLESEIEVFIKEKENYILSNKKKLEAYSEFVDTFMIKSEKFINKIATFSKRTYIKSFINGYFNAANSVEIGYGYKDTMYFGKLKE